MTTLTAPREVEVPAYLLDTLRDREAALAKRCRRLGLPAPVVTITRQWLAQRLDEQQRPYLQPMMAYTVDGERPQLAGGWQVLAVVEHHDTGNIVNTAPQFADVAPTDLLHAPSTCDHCGHNRRRKHTVVIQDAAGNRHRVGKACLRDFTGHDLPAVWETFADDLTAWDDERGAAGRSEHQRVDYVVAVAVAVIERDGWAPADSERPTRTTVSNCLVGLVDRVNPTVEQRATAVAALQWIVSTTDADGYIANLRSVVLADAAADHLGLVASLPRAYAKHVERQQRAAQRETQRATELRTPCPTGRITLAGVVVSTDIKFTEWGNRQQARHVVTFRDDRGFTVWGSAPVVEFVDNHGLKGGERPSVGDRLTFTATLEPSNRDECFGFFTRPTKVARLPQGDKQ